MQRTAGIRLMVSSGALALALAPSLLHAQVAVPIQVTPVQATAQAAPVQAPAQAAPMQTAPMRPAGAGAALAPVQAVSPPKTSKSDYDRSKRGLTRDQLAIGYELCKLDEKVDRARVLKLIRRTRDSLDFAACMYGPRTPLTLAAFHGDAEMVGAIMAKGMPARAPNAGRPIDEALEGAVGGMSGAVFGVPNVAEPGAYLALVKLLLKDGASPVGNGSLGLALQANPNAANRTVRFEVVKLLLEHGASPGTVQPGSLSYLADDDLLNLLLAHALKVEPGQSTEVLVDAVQSRIYTVAKLALAKGADPNVRPEGAQYPLINMMEWDEPSVKLLLAGGADPAACKSGACGPLEHPLIFMIPSDPALLSLMIARGADPNAVDRVGTPALGHALWQSKMIACPVTSTPEQCMDEARRARQRAAAAAIVLLKAGARPNDRAGGMLPLMLAEDGEHELIVTLLDMGARMEPATPEGQRVGPITMALLTKRPFLAEEIMRRTKGSLGSDEQWALLSAACCGSVALAEGLVQHGAKPNAHAPFGETALHYAAARGDAAMLRSLLALGANPNVQTDTMPYSQSEHSLNPLVIGLALARAKLDDAKEAQYRAVGLTPLVFSDDVGRYGGATPLMFAAASGNVEAVRVLLAGGAKPDLRSGGGGTALGIARAKGYGQIVQLLEQHN